MTSKILGIQDIGFQWKTESPFLFSVHHHDHYPAGNAELGPASGLDGRELGSDFSGINGYSMYHGEVVPGFPAHPHRGFETVTVVLKGLIDHFDSTGAEGRYGDGDVQWMTAGKGCQHSEMMPLVNMDKENPTELFQIWLNLPKKDKMVEPDYKMLWREDIPIVETTHSNGSKAKVRLIAGNYQGHNSLSSTPNSWASKKENHVGIMLVEMEPGSEFVIPAISDTLLRNVYFYQGDGTIYIDGQAIPSSKRIKLAGNDDIVITNGDQMSYLLLLEGEPINEPVVQYGPFVMNTKEEIQQAFNDYRATEFGGWPWDSYDRVHDRTTGRFASYSDGRVEQK